MVERFDSLIARLLFVRPQPESAALPKDAERVFNTSIVLSAARCIIQYVVLPFVLPVIGVASNVAVPISLTLEGIAVVAILFSLRRFWQVRYKGRWGYLALASAALVLLTVFIVTDLSKLT
jgi:ABC-type iron transport system FetAB permease component